MTTEFAGFCKRRQCAGRFECRLSNNWTFVVTTPGAAQAPWQGEACRAPPDLDGRVINGRMMVETDFVAESLATDGGCLVNGSRRRSDRVCAACMLQREG